MDATQEFLGHYIQPGQTGLKATFLEESDGIQEIRAYLDEVALQETLAAEYLADLRFVG